MRISCVDSSDFAGWSSSLWMSNPIPIANTKDMVDKVLARVGKGKISRLDINDHGTAISIQVGADQIFDSSLAFHTELSRLNGHFTENGFVVLMQCNSGKAVSLLKKLAKDFGVRVYASTGIFAGGALMRPLPIQSEYVCMSPAGALTKTSPP